MSAAKRATDALCEIMQEVGHSCCPESHCWKKAECPEAQKLAEAVAPKKKEW
jgi:hypothetical protein